MTACLILLAVWMRSIRLAVAAVIPMGLVVSWLYAFMYLAGFHLNFVTATIAAVSVGLGIDYSIHVTLRFRREMEHNPDRTAALRATASGVGGAADRIGGVQRHRVWRPRVCSNAPVFGLRGYYRCDDNHGRRRCPGGAAIASDARHREHNVKGRTGPDGVGR